MAHTWLSIIARIGMGLSVLIFIGLDIKCRVPIFDLMQQKKVPQPWLFFVSALCLKFITSVALILNFYPVAAALLLSLYVLIANIVFNNFWAVPKENREFTFGMFMLHIVMCFGLIAIAGCI